MPTVERMGIPVKCVTVSFVFNADDLGIAVTNATLGSQRRQIRWYRNFSFRCQPQDFSLIGVVEQMCNHMKTAINAAGVPRNEGGSARSGAWSSRRQSSCACGRASRDSPASTEMNRGDVHPLIQRDGRRLTRRWLRLCSFRMQR